MTRLCHTAFTEAVVLRTLRCASGQSGFPRQTFADHTPKSKADVTATVFFGEGEDLPILVTSFEADGAAL